MKLPNKFFVSDKYGHIFLVTKDESDMWWIQEDYTHEDYDPFYDIFGTIKEECLMEEIQSGEYQIVPESEGWISLELEL